MDNVCVPLYDQGKNVTGKPTVAVIVKRFVKITTNAGKGNPFNIGPATAALKPFGVAAYDAPVGDVVPVVRGGIVPIKAVGAIVAGAEVEVAANGSVSTKTAGVAVGTCVYDVADTVDAIIALFI